MSIKEQNEHILGDVIEGYRNSISKRYQYQIIKKNYDIPNSINEETVTQLREYFLNYLYPSNNQRKELDDAFKSLDDYIKNPQKLLRIAIDTAKLFLKYGRHLPKILSTGLDALKTFNAATNFEKSLAKSALKNDIVPPYDDKKIDLLMKNFSREKIEIFITSSQTLFKILHDRVLIKKIKSVIAYLITAMKKNNKAYSISQIKGLEIGLEMINEGDKLFTKLTEENQQNLITIIAKIERDNLNRIFGNPL